MLDVNMIIANNIQVDLAEGIGVSKQTMSKIMNGARAIIKFLNTYMCRWIL